MAFLAFGSITASMHVLNGMTVDAGVRQALVLFADVADDAGNILVLAREREACLAMVERRRLFPAFGRVASFASFTESAFVRLVLPVAANAVMLRRTELLSGTVTSLAGGGRMGAFEPEIGQTMVESRVIERRDLGLSAFVVGVAVLALDAGHICPLAVEARLVGEILGHILVAVEAQLVLYSFFERLVTARAILLEFCMSFDDLTGRDQPLEQALCLSGKKKPGSHQSRDCAPHGPDRHLQSPLNRGGLR